jgi:hypothetical protein
MAFNKKCTHCSDICVPVVNVVTLEDRPEIRICRKCYKDRTHWDFPYAYDKYFERHRLAFFDKHPKIPSAFLDTVYERLPEQLRLAYIKAPIIFSPEAGNKCHMILHGPTGMCKSRVAWLIISKIWKERWPYNAEFYSMRRLEGEIEESFGEYGSVKGHGKFIDKICNLDLLVLDDLGKEQMTNRMEADLFAIIDSRTINQKYTILTTNHVGDGIADRFRNKETGEPFVRRLREYFVPFSVTV